MTTAQASRDSSTRMEGKKKDTYIVQGRLVSYGDDSVKTSGHVVTMADGKRIHVITRNTLQRAIRSAMKEFA